MTENNKEEGHNPYIELVERVAKLEESMTWVKDLLGKMDKRMWWILGSVVILGIIAILISLYG